MVLVVLLRVVAAVSLPATVLRPVVACNVSLYGFDAGSFGSQNGNRGNRPSLAETLKECGAVVVRRALEPRQLLSTHDAFRQLPDSVTKALRHGRVREQRIQTHLPFSPPFDTLELFGVAGALHSTLQEALGDGFVLDLLTIVEVPPGAPMQEPHRDTQLDGSLAMHIPLHNLSKHLAPLSFCAGTHQLSHDDVMQVMREAILWRQKGETSLAAKQRLYCGGRQPTEAFQVELRPNSTAHLRIRDSRLGVAVSSVEALGQIASSGIRIADEVTHINGKRVSSVDDFHEIVVGSRDTDILTLHMERPVSHSSHRGPPQLVVAAPLEVGDVFLYNSRTFHWGMAHNSTQDSGPRLVLYANFMSNLKHAGVHPEAEGTPEFQAARRGFQTHVATLRGKWANNETTASQSSEL